MVALSRELLVLFSVLTTAVFLWRFIRDKNMSGITFNKLLPTLRVPLAIVIPVAAVLYASSLIGMNQSLGAFAPYFAAAVALPYFLSQIGLPPFLRGLLLLGASVAMSCFLAADSFHGPVEATLAGLIAWKSAENLLLRESSSEMEDFLPSFLYLGGMYWLRLTDSASFVAQHQNLILSTFVVSIFMRWIQDPFLKEDKLYVKRIALSVTGGLFLLILITKMIVALELAKMAAIAGAGFFLTYLIQAMDKACENDSLAQKCFKQLVFIGIFTLVATRLFLTPGVIVLAVATLIATRNGAARIATLYWGSYVLMQAFIFQYNSNMTGVNIMHSYTAAGLYAGLLIAVTGCLMLKQKMDDRSRALLFVSAGIIAPGAIGYFLHAEPTASLLLASLIGATLMSVFIPAFGSEDAKGRENLMLIPAQLISVGMLTGELINKGLESDTQQRVIALVILSVVSTALLALASWLPRRSAGADAGSINSNTPAPPPEQPAGA